MQVGSPTPFKLSWKARSFYMHTATHLWVPPLQKVSTCIQPHICAYSHYRKFLHAYSQTFVRTATTKSFYMHRATHLCVPPVQKVSTCIQPHICAYSHYRKFLHAHSHYRKFLHAHSHTPVRTATTESLPFANWKFKNENIHKYTFVQFVWPRNLVHHTNGRTRTGGN